MRHSIPDNHQEGSALFGKIVSGRNLLETVLFAGPVIFLVMRYAGWWEFHNRIVPAFCIAAPILFFGLNGINGDTLTQFIGNYLSYSRKKRIMLYNPRIKTEAKPIAIEDSVETIPIREQAQKLVRRIKDYFKARQAYARREKRAQAGVGNIFFRDDIGILAKPEEYKTDREIAREKKKAKREREKKKTKSK